MFISMTLAELCKLSSMPRPLIDRYLAATRQEKLLHKRQWLAEWEWILADLPAFQAYLDHNRTNRAEAEIAARSGAITIAIWKYANPRMQMGQRITERLRRIRNRLITLQAKTSPAETGQRVTRACKKFPYTEAGNEFYNALETIRPDRIRRHGNTVTLLAGRPFTVSEEIAIVDSMISVLAKEGARLRDRPREEFIEALATDHEWLTGRSRRQYGAQFRQFVEAVLEGDLTKHLPEDLRRTGLVAATLLR